MIEVTIAVCPPEGERRIVLTGKIENVTPEQDNLADYRCTFQGESREVQFLLTGFLRTTGSTALVNYALQKLDRISFENWVKSTRKESVP